MKLISAVDIAKACGLRTIKDAFANIDIHCMSIFAYTRIEEELIELKCDIIDLFNIFGRDVSSDDDITIEEYENYIGGDYESI